jgi:hypothetical protein
MDKLPRTVWEILALVVLAAVGYGFWTWSDYRWQQRVGDVDRQLRGELAAERESSAEALARRRAREGEMVGRAFAAGIRTAVAAGRREAVDAAVGELLRIPGVVFAHVLERDGGVIATSDRKLVTTGQAGPRAAWALAAREVAVRPGDGPETTEVAVPVAEGDAGAAVLWIAYDLGMAASPAETPAPEAPRVPEVPETEGEPV